MPGNWQNVNYNGKLYGTNIDIETNEIFDTNDTRTHIIWIKHHGDSRSYPTSSIYDGTVLDSIPKHWIPEINKKRIHIVIDTMEESWGPIYKNTINHVDSCDVHKILEKNANRLCILPTQITWLTGDMNAEDYCLGSKINVKSVCMFLWYFANIIRLSNIDLDYFKNSHNNLTHFLISPNRFPKAHRAYTVAKLYEYSQLDEYAFHRIRYSFPKDMRGLPNNTIFDAYNKLKYRKDTYPDFFDRNDKIDWKKLFDTIQKLETTLPSRIDDVDFDKNYCSGIDAICSIGDYYKTSAYSLVTETWAEGRKLFISDALFMSILYRTPLLLIGCRHSLKFLRSKGFRTFSNFIDESYDDIEDDVDRWNAVLAEVKRLGTETNSEVWISKRQELKYILEHNFSHMFSLAPKEEQDFNIYLNSL